MRKRFRTHSLFGGFLLLFIFAAHGGHSQSVVLNEICPANVSGLVGTGGEYNDWIEIYNRSSTSQSIYKWGLSDDPLNRFKFRFPNITLAPGRRLIVFPTGFNTVTDHWSCAAGKGTTSNWRVYSGSSAPPTNWKDSTFSPTSSWASKTIPMGYGSNYSSAVGSTGSISGTPLAIGLRKTFSISDTSLITEGAVFVDYDDGYVLYLNGVQISRSNFIGTNGWNDTLMTSRNANFVTGLAPDSIYLSKALLSQLLVQGTNVISMETHTRSTNDLYASCYLFLGVSDTTTPFVVDQTSSLQPAPTASYTADFKMSRIGETIYLTDSTGANMDSFQYGYVESDNSWGRCGDGINNWALFATPTPGAANGTGSACNAGYANTPILTPQAGFYPGRQTIQVLPPFQSGATYRYTKNGNVPTLSSPVYSGPITLDTSTTIRIRAFVSGYLPSRVVNSSYIIGTDLKLPVFTITTDSLNLWDWNTGIYVLGPNASSSYPYQGANFWQDWKKPAHIEYFDKQRVRLFDFDAEINIDGNYTQAKPQKSFGIGLADRFGLGNINYNFIKDKPFLTDNKDIVLRNMGNDWNKCHLRDPFMERMMKNTYSGYIASEPCILFLNGAFWGVYSFHELDNSNWVQENIGLKKGEFDYLKESGSTIDPGTDYSSALFWEIYNYTQSHDPGTGAYYAWIDGHIDLKNLTDYFICETYVNNDDWLGYWTNNIKMWNERGPGGKLHYLMYDLDMGFGYGGSSVTQDRLSLARVPVPPAFSYSSEIFDTILYNPTFRRYFINRYADLMNSTFLRDSLNPVLSSYSDSIAPDLPEQFLRWGNDMTIWGSNINDMKNWYYRRTSYVRSHILSNFANFGVTSQVTWTLDVNPPGAGRILISTIIPPVYPWSGVYFNNNPVTITAIPNPGYTFDHWVSNTLGNTNTSQSVTVNYTQSQLTTAYFTGTARTPQIYFTEINYNSDSASDCGDWVEIYNKGSFSVDLTDWEFRDQYDYHRYTFPSGTVIPAGGYMVLATDMDKFRAIHPAVTNVIGPIGFNLANNGDQIRILDYRDRAVDSVYYMDLSPWPTLPDGFGYTCERLTPPNNPYDANNWFPGCYGGSPGRAYGAALGSTMHVTGGTSFCSGDSVTIRVPSVPGALYQWYRNTSAVSGATDSVLTTARAGQYYVLLTFQGCSSRSDTITVTQVTQNVAPAVTPAYRCGEGTLSISATASDTVYWFTSSSGGTPVDTGNVFDTPYLLSNTTFYAQAGLSCASQRTPAVAQILQFTADPVVPNDTVVLCGPGAVTLTAVDTAVMRWYNDPVGGALLATNDTFRIALLPNDTIVYVEAGTLCPSNRVSILVEVFQTSSPTVNSSSRCGDGRLVLMANSPDPLAWFDSVFGTTPVCTTSTFFTPVLSATTTYYVQSNGSCPSARVPVVATIYPIPPVPVVYDTVLCSPDSISLYAVSPEQVMWYDSAAGGTLLFTGSLFTTPLIDTTTTYFVESVSQTCNSARVPYTVEMFSPPVGFLGGDTIVASGTYLTLQADTNAIMYIWNTGATTSSITVSSTVSNDSTGFYSVNCIYRGGCAASDNIRVDFSTAVEPPPGAVTVQGVYPNPAQDHARLVLQSNSRIGSRIEIIDMTGRTLQTMDKVISKGTNRIDLSFPGYAAGCYFIRIIYPDYPTILYKMVVN
ncbi:MAG: hypothetical protein RL213_1050 [Bacteroidota bacterium]